MIKNILLTKTDYSTNTMGKQYIVNKKLDIIDSSKLDDIIKLARHLNDRKQEGYRAKIFYEYTNIGLYPVRITISNVIDKTKLIYELNYKESKLSGRGITRSKEFIQ